MNEDYLQCEMSGKCGALSIYRPIDRIIKS